MSGREDGIYLLQSLAAASRPVLGTLFHCSVHRLSPTFEIEYRAFFFSLCRAVRNWLMKYSLLELNIFPLNVFVFVSLEHTKPQSRGKELKNILSFNWSPQVKVLCVFYLVILVSG